MVKKQLKCYLYLRVSTEIQIEGYSLEAQEDRLRAEAKHRNMQVMGMFKDEGKSGKNIQGRPEFRRMLKLIEQQTDSVDYVLVFKLSRFGRNTADTLNSLQLMQDYGVNLLCVEDGIDSSGPAGKLLISVYAAVAEGERENILAQTLAGRWQKAKDGKWNGAQAPFGYSLQDGMLVVNEDEAKIIRLIFEKYTNDGLGVNLVAKWLNEHGYTKKVYKNSTLTSFSAHYVKNVLDNPVYAGFIAYGRRKNEKIAGSRNEYHVVKQENYSLFEGQHEAIIDRDLWNRTKAKRELNNFKREKKFSLEHAHVLSGIVRCPRCNGPMYGVVNRKKKKNSDEYYTDMWYYLCKNRQQVSGHFCDYKKHLQQDVINEQVEVIVKTALKDVDFTTDVFDKLGNQNNLSELQETLERLKSAKSKEEAKKSKLLSKIMALDPSDDTYDMLYDDLHGLLREIAVNLSGLEDNIYKTECAISNATNEQYNADAVYKVMASMIEMIDMLPDEDERVVMNYLLDSVQLYEEQQPNGLWVKSVRFKVPINLDGNYCDEVLTEIPDSLPNEKTVETIALLQKSVRKSKPDTYVKFSLDMEEYYKIKEQGK